LLLLLLLLLLFLLFLLLLLLLFLLLLLLLLQSWAVATCAKSHVVLQADAADAVSTRATARLVGGGVHEICAFVDANWAKQSWGLHSQNALSSIYCGHAYNT
jgi:hypothetical protein